MNILPDKYVRPGRSLLGKSAKLLPLLTSDGQTISETWVNAQAIDRELHFDQFVAALDLLFMLGAIELRHGVLRRSSK